ATDLTPGQSPGSRPFRKRPPLLLPAQPVFVEDRGLLAGQDLTPVPDLADEDAFQMVVLAFEAPDLCVQPEPPRTRPSRPRNTPARDRRSGRLPPRSRQRWRAYLEVAGRRSAALFTCCARPRA